MEKNGDTFFYRSMLLVGFRYRYNFLIDDEFDHVIDETKPFEKNRKGKLTNIFEVPFEREKDEPLPDLVKL